MSKPNKNESVFTMSIAELEDRVAKAKQLLGEIEALLPGIVTMTDDDRRHSDGRLRDGEDVVLRTVIDVADKHPQYFTALADKDGGVDPKTFETDLLRDHLARRTLLAEVTRAAEEITAPLADTVLSLGGQVRPVVLSAYQIAKSIAAADERLRAQLAPAIDFFGRIGRRGAATRAKKPLEAAK